MYRLHVGTLGGFAVKATTVTICARGMPPRYDLLLLVGADAKPEEEINVRVQRLEKNSYTMIRGVLFQVVDIHDNIPVLRRAVLDAWGNNEQWELL